VEEEEYVFSPVREKTLLWFDAAVLKGFSGKEYGR